VFGAVSGCSGCDCDKTTRCKPFCGPGSGRRDWLVVRVRRIRGGQGAPVLFVLGRWDVAERFVQAAVVEPADVLDRRELELRPGAPDAVGDQLGLERIDERLGERVGERRRLRSILSLRSELFG